MKSNVKFTLCMIVLGGFLIGFFMDENNNSNINMLILGCLLFVLAIINNQLLILNNQIDFKKNIEEKIEEEIKNLKEN